MVHDAQNLYSTKKTLLSSEQNQSCTVRFNTQDATYTRGKPLPGCTLIVRAIWHHRICISLQIRKNPQQLVWCYTYANNRSSIFGNNFRSEVHTGSKIRTLSLHTLGGSISVEFLSLLWQHYLNKKFLQLYTKQLPHIPFCV